MSFHTALRTSRAHVFIVAVSGVLTLGACSSGDNAPAASEGDGTGTIDVWAHQGQDGEVTALEEAVAAFNESQDDVAVELRLIPEADYTTTIQATATEDLPDVLEFDGPLLSSFVYDGRLSPLDELVSQDTVDNQIKSAVSQNTYPGDDGLYGVSMFDAGLGIYGNKALLDAAGVEYPTRWEDAWTAEEFGAALDALAEEDEDGRVLDIKESYGGEWPSFGFLPILSSAGTAVVADGQASGALDSEAAVDAVATFSGWADRVDPNAEDNAFDQGRVALSWVGHWMYPAYSEALGDDLVVMPLPDFGNGTKSGQGSWAWGVSSSSDDGAAAGAFLDYLVSDEPVGQMTTANGAPPATVSGQAASDLYAEGGPLELFASQLAATCGTSEPTPECVTVPRPVTPAYPVISADFSRAFLGAYQGGDVAELLTDASASIDQAYEDNNGFE